MHMDARLPGNKVNSDHHAPHNLSLRNPTVKISQIDNKSFQWNTLHFNGGRVFHDFSRRAKFLLKKFLIFHIFLI